MNKKLYQITEIKTGFLFKEGIRPDKEGNVSVIQLKDVIEGRLFDKNDFIRTKVSAIDPSNFVSLGDVLFKAKTNRPTAVVLKEPLSNTITTAHFFVIQVKVSNVLPGYLAWYLNQRPAQFYFDRNAGGTRVQVINKQVLGDLDIAIPDLKVQENIEKIATLQQQEYRLLNLLKENKQRLIKAQLLNIIKGSL